MKGDFASLVHAIGEGGDEAVCFIGPTNLVTYKHVRCAHAAELLEVLTSGVLQGGGAHTWLRATDGSVFRVGAMFGAEISSPQIPGAVVRG